MTETPPEPRVCNGVMKLRKKIVKDHRNIVKFVEAWRASGHRIVMTIGSWDLYHIGHARYLTAALEHGDVLIVGVDSDRSMKLYKEPGRPAVPEEERMEMLCYLPGVNLVTIVDDVDDKGRWQYDLLKLVQPDVFVAVEGSYPDSQIQEIKEIGATEVIVLPRQAETSTSNMIRNMLLKKPVDMVRES